MKMRFPLLAFILILVASCTSVHKKTEIDELFRNKNELTSLVDYAEGFDIYENSGVYKLDIYDPRNKGQVYFSCYITKNEVYRNQGNVFIIPTDSVAVMSSTQLNAFSVLDLLDKVVGTSESDYIHNVEIKKLVEKGKIQNLASNGNFYLEKVLEISPHIIFYSPYNLSQKHPLVSTCLPMVPLFDYMETNPLGRAEWIKFTALFFDKQERANNIFDTIVSKYQMYKALADGVKNKPTVFADKYFAGQWFVPGGQSYIANLFRDAGSDYIWADNEQKASINLDFETVFSKAHEADFWRIVSLYPGGFSYHKLGAENELYKQFDAFQNHHVIFCDSEKSTYFETGTLEPHIMLGDLIHAFHPELLPDYKPKYYYLYSQ